MYAHHPQHSQLVARSDNAHQFLHSDCDMLPTSSAMDTTSRTRYCCDQRKSRRKGKQGCDCASPTASPRPAVAQSRRGSSLVCHLTYSTSLCILLLLLSLSLFTPTSTAHRQGKCNARCMHSVLCFPPCSMEGYGLAPRVIAH